MSERLGKLPAESERDGERLGKSTRRVRKGRRETGEVYQPGLKGAERDWGSLPAGSERGGERLGKSTSRVRKGRREIVEIDQPGQ